MTRGDAEVRGGLRASASRRCRDELGATTAEAAVVLPVLVVLALGLVWVLSLALTHVRVVDGAREGARAAARGESAAAARAAALRVAPAGATVDVRHGGATVAVLVSASVSGPGGLFRALPSVAVSSRAVAAEEPR